MSVQFTVADHVARVTLDRPDRLNAVDPATEAELMRIWSAIEGNREVRVVVLTGAGDRAFCTGADMKGGSGSSGLEYWATPRPGGFGGIALRDTLDVPVIARVNGHALGGGMEMALGCDIVVASANASFGLPEPRVGRLALDGGIALLTRRIPHVWAMGMLLTGRRIDAAEALRFGLVNEVVPLAELDAAVDALGRRHPRLRAAVGARDQTDGARRREALRAGGADAAAAGAGRGAAIVRPGRGRARVPGEAQAAVAGAVTSPSPALAGEGWGEGRGNYDDPRPSRATAPREGAKAAE